MRLTWLGTQAYLSTLEAGGYWSSGLGNQMWIDRLLCDQNNNIVPRSIWAIYMDESWYWRKSSLNANWFMPSKTHVYKGFMNNCNGSGSKLGRKGKWSVLEGHNQSTCKWSQTIIRKDGAN